VILPASAALFAARRAGRSRFWSELSHRGWWPAYPAPMRMHGLAERRVRRLLSAHGVEVVAADPTTLPPGVA